MLVLDTSVLIDLEREIRADRLGAVRRFMGVNRGEDFACSTISIGELAVRGAEVAVRVLLARVRKIPVSEAIAYRAGALDREMLSLGRRLGENDNWIAATALHYSATLVYSDGDFDRIGGLKRMHLPNAGRLGRGNDRQ